MWPAAAYELWTNVAGAPLSVVYHLPALVDWRHRTDASYPWRLWFRHLLLLVPTHYMARLHKVNSPSIASCHLRQRHLGVMVGTVSRFFLLIWTSVEAAVKQSGHALNSQCWGNQSGTVPDSIAVCAGLCEESVPSHLHERRIVFSRGAESGKICFCLLETNKQPIFAKKLIENFKVQGNKGPFTTRMRSSDIAVNGTYAVNPVGCIDWG